MTNAARPLFLAAALVAMLLGLPAYAQEGETAAREGFPPGYKGLPGAKDPGEPGRSDGWEAIDLKIVPETDWKFRTPNDTLTVAKGDGVTGNWRNVTGGELPLMGLRGAKLRFEPRTGAIFLDTDGDGSLETPVKQELLAVRAKRPDGSEGPFYFKLRRGDKSYYYTRACMAVGKWNGTQIAFIDEDNNGCFGDPSTDAIRIGGALTAINQSSIVNLGNVLYHVRVDQAGTRAWFKTYEGPTGKLDLATKYRAASKLLYAMVSQGECIFDAAEKDTVVPIGEWTMFDGLVGPSIYQSAKIKQGNMAPVVVKEGETIVIEWGMPGKIDFSCEKKGTQLTIRTSSIRIYGKAGEEYVNFQPKKFTPNVQAALMDGTEVYYGNMGFGC